MPKHDRINKPKVFLSHSWKDKPFIEKVAGDLRLCQIDYWLDREEIRDGRSWLKVIFEDGIPTCDAVLVYLTEHSIKSKMVEKELDAAVVRQLQESSVALLPYVSESSLRGHLRSDLQTLQCREWNKENYDQLLPSVVGEIWRSYLERTIESAVLQERTRRLEQELENKRLREQYAASVFSANEEQEFVYLRKQLDRKIPLTFELLKKNDEDNSRSKIAEEQCHVSLLQILLAVINGGGVNFDPHYIEYYVVQVLGEDVNVDGQQVIRDPSMNRMDDRRAANIVTELNTYGLTKVTTGDRWGPHYEISEKMYRLKYWLEYNKMLDDSPVQHSVTIVPYKPPEAKSKDSKGEEAAAEALAADKRIAQSRRLSAWRISGEGTLAATKEIQSLFNDLKQRVTNSNAVLENIRLEFEADKNTCSIKTNGILMSLTWKCPSNDTRECTLGIAVIALTLKKEALPHGVFSMEFSVDADKKLELIWRQKDGSSEKYSVATIADICWRSFISAIQRNEDGFYDR